MRYFRLLLVIVFFASVQMSNAQQQAIYTQYMFNHVSINSAYAASKLNPVFMVLARTQWVSMEGAPFSGTVNFHLPIKREKIGIGASLLSDKIGPISQTGIFLDYAYQIKFSSTDFLAFGAKIGFDFYKANLSRIYTIQNNDVAFSNDVRNNFMPNLGFGLFYYSKKYYVGLSVPKFIQNTLNSDNAQFNSYSKEQRHFFLIGGYVFDINSSVKFKPSVLMKYVQNAPLSADLNGSFLLRDRIWIGATYRFGDALSGMVEVKIGESLLVGYSFDFATTKLVRYNYGTHEVLISYELNFDKNRVKSPRYF